MKLYTSFWALANTKIGSTQVTLILKAEGWIKYSVAASSSVHVHGALFGFRDHVWF